MEEQYNPEKHCCDKWYKDFCRCLTDLKQAERDLEVKATLEFLKENNIPYEGSKISNVVIVNPDTEAAYLSLKKKRGYFNVKLKGQTKWQRMGDKRFLKLFHTHKPKSQGRIK